MTERVNFLEKGAYSITYKKMAIYAGIWIGFCILIYFIIGGYSWWTTKKFDAYKVQLAGLNIKKERTMAMIEAQQSKVVAPDVQELSEIYTSYPVWSKVLSVLSENIPAHSWLTTISSEYLSDSSMLRKLEIIGMSRSAESIARYAKLLNQNEYFRNVILSKAERIADDARKPGYTFILVGEVRFGEKKWR